LKAMLILSQNLINMCHLTNYRLEYAFGEFSGRHSKLLFKTQGKMGRAVKSTFIAHLGYVAKVFFN